MSTLKNFIQSNQERFLFFCIAILIAVISFYAGMLKEREKSSSPIKVFLNNSSNLKTEDKQALALGKAVQRKNLTSQLEKENVIGEGNCLFVGSKNSDKYHISSCHWAERIKEENRVCFKSKKEAEEKNYIPGSCNDK